ncbi:MAG: YihY/virulence factor BrkB family protein, partial [Actinomycetota bacterium]|nr:YihY/virulence factor BrkB family protein [Actinomycetota bacterium]
DFFSEEKRDADSAIHWLAGGVPAFRLVNTCHAGRYRIEKQIVTDPERDTVLQQVRFVAQQGALSDYHLYVLLPALALGPDVIISLLPSSLAGDGATAIHVLYWPVVGLGSVAVLNTMYMLCLPVRVRWRRGIPGAVVAMTAWLMGSFVVRAYLESSFQKKSVYGSLSAPIAALLFFYVTALAVLIGAELNSAIDAVWPVPSTASGRAQSVRKARDREVQARRAGRKPIRLGDPSIGDTWGDLPGDAQIS